MNFYKTGNVLHVLEYGGSQQNLEAGKIYNVSTNQNGVSVLTESSESININHTVYGGVDEKVKKILSAYERRGTLGVLFSGSKGTGKSLTMTITAQRSNLPIIVFSGQEPSFIKDLVSKINQPVCLLFDEFEKYYRSYESQEKFLSMFDGIEKSNNLILITSNEQISPYFLNRPGRIYYNFEFQSLNRDETMEVLLDLLEDKSLVKPVSDQLMFVDTTYDILRSIADEINNTDLSIEEVFSDINVFNSETRVSVTLIDEEGDRFHISDVSWEPGSKHQLFWLTPTKQTVEKYKEASEVASEAKRTLIKDKSLSRKEKEHYIELSKLKFYSEHSTKEVMIPNTEERKDVEIKDNMFFFKDEDGRVYIIKKQDSSSHRKSRVIDHHGEEMVLMAKNSDF